MAKLTTVHTDGGINTFAGCALTGVCGTAADVFAKIVTLADADTIYDGMSVAVTFDNGNSAGNAPVPQTVYSSDQVTYYSDSGMTVPVTLPPQGCYTIEYTGTGNVYTLLTYPLVSVGNVSGPLCSANGKECGGTAWSSGDTVLLLYTGGKFLMQSVVVNTVQSGNVQPVTSNAVAQAIGQNVSTMIITGITPGWWKLGEISRRNLGFCMKILLSTDHAYYPPQSTELTINYANEDFTVIANSVNAYNSAQAQIYQVCLGWNSNNTDKVGVYIYYNRTQPGNVFITVLTSLAIAPTRQFVQDIKAEIPGNVWANTKAVSFDTLHSNINGNRFVDESQMVYSTTAETETGETWVSGAKIYKKTYLFENVSLVSGSNKIASNFEIAKSKIVKMDSLMWTSSWVISGEKVYCLSSQDLYIFQSMTSSTTAGIYVTVYYVK